MLIQTLSTLWLAATLATPAEPQTAPYKPPRARRQFISISLDRQSVQPTTFDKHPLEEILGREVNEVHLESFQYRTRDLQTQVNIREFGSRATGIGATIYPFGASSGATLALRGSVETLPPIRLAFTGPAPAPVYELTHGRAYDLGVGIDMSDRAPGWGLGSHAFVLGGIGRAQTDQRSGKRYFAEGGGGVQSGPFGVDLSVKYTVSQFSSPVPHSVRLIPVTVRATLTF